MASIYSFKTIKPIHSATEMVDVVLSKTQRKTPTEVHPKYQILRIREFYMRKVKFTAASFCEKLDEILLTFPKLNDIHPFFADLLNVLYDKDHYKIALGQVNITKGMIERLAKDYVKLLKFGENLFGCKQLKVAALGRMCTAIKKLKASLEFLEEVRKHLRRLPGIDPFAPTALLFGFPNVGKSSFINQITKADVEISAMPFSTQNLFVGHTMHKNVKIQFLDSPGVLDRALEQRNTIEMQSITALAHLKTMVIFMVDISESCGHSIADQLKLFETLRPLFSRKPAVLVLTKVDLCPFNAVEQEGKTQIEQFHQNNPDVEIIELSSNEKDLVENLKVKACNKLLDFRQSSRKGVTGLKTDEDYLRGVSIIAPKNITGRNRGTCIPDSVVAERQSGVKEKRQTLKDLQEESGGAGVFNFPWNEHFMLSDDAWKYDKVPEIINGMNIADYVDPEIEAKLQALEEDHERLLNMQDEEMIDEEEEEDNEALKQVKDKRAVNMLNSRLTKNNRVSKNRTTLSSLQEKLAQKGKNSKKVNQRMMSIKERSQKRKLNNMMGGMEIEDKKPDSLHKRQRETERAKWMKNDQFVEKKRRKIQKKSLRDGQMGDADRHIYTKKPKHLYSGKLGRGKTDWR